MLLCRHLGYEEPTWILPGGTPHQGEGAASCARREVFEETGILIDPDRVAFILETTSPDSEQHLMEIVFLGFVRDRTTVPVDCEAHLKPEFVALSELSNTKLLPPIAGYLRGFARDMSSINVQRYGIASYLGNVWRPPEAPIVTMEVGE